MVRKALENKTPSSLPVVQVSEPDVAAAPASTPTPVVKKSKKTESAAATAAPATVETVATLEEVPLKNEVVVVVEESDKKDEITSRFSDFSTKLHNSTIQLNALRTEFKQLEKQLLKDIKSLKKSKGKKNKSTSGNRKPSGFTCPTLISNELASFLGKPDGVEMARTEVSKELTKYINDNHLKDPANGRNILPDDKLVALLKIDKNNDKLNIFNIHRFMKPHFTRRGET